MKGPIVINLPVPESLLWLGLLGAAALFAVVSVVVSHHWSYYGLSSSDREFSSALYYVGGVGLLVVMGLCAAAYGFWN